MLDKIDDLVSKNWILTITTNGYTVIMIGMIFCAICGAFGLASWFIKGK